MHSELLSLFLSSSLVDTMTDCEIEELVIEIEDSLESIIDDKVKENVDEIENDYSNEVEALEKKLRVANDKLDNTLKLSPGQCSLMDTIVAEWATNNWEKIVELYNSNI